MDNNINWSCLALYELTQFSKSKERELWKNNDVEKLVNEGLISKVKEPRTYTITPKGKKELTEIQAHFDSGDISSLPLRLRKYYFDWENHNADTLPVENLTKVALYDKSDKICEKAFRLLDEYDALSENLYDHFAHDENPEIRIIAAKKADSRNYFDEKDPRVAIALIENRGVSEECRHHWYKDTEFSRQIIAQILGLR